MVHVNEYSSQYKITLLKVINRYVHITEYMLNNSMHLLLLLGLWLMDAHVKWFSVC